MRKFSILLSCLALFYVCTAFGLTLDRIQKNTTWEETRTIINRNSSRIEADAASSAASNWWQYAAQGTVDIGDNILTNVSAAYIDNIHSITGSFTDLVISGDLQGSLIPSVDNTYDIGSSSAQWKDLYLSDQILFTNGNIRIGEQAGGTVPFTGTDNIFIGYKTGGQQASDARVGSQNTFIGYLAGDQLNSSGSYTGNLAIGHQAFYGGGDSTYSTFIGYKAGYISYGNERVTVIGGGRILTETNTIVINNQANPEAIHSASTALFYADGDENYFNLGRPTDTMNLRGTIATFQAATNQFNSGLTASADIIAEDAAYVHELTEDARTGLGNNTLAASSLLSPFFVSEDRSTAYFGRAAGFYIYDVTDGNFGLISSVTPGGNTLSVYYENGTFYLGDATLGVRAYDVTDPTNPSLIWTKAGTSVSTLVTKGGYMYVSRAAGLEVFDIKSDDTPALVATTNDTGTIASIYIEGDRLYGLAGADGVYIYDISDPTSIANVGQITNQVGNVSDMVVRGNIAYVGELSYSATLLTYALSDEANPVLLDQYGAADPASAQGQFVKFYGKDHILVSDNAGFVTKLLDVSDPTAITYVDYGSVKGTANQPIIGARAWNKLPTTATLYNTEMKNRIQSPFAELGYVFADDLHVSGDIAGDDLLLRGSIAVRGNIMAGNSVGMDRILSIGDLRATWDSSESNIDMLDITNIDSSQGTGISLGSGTAGGYSSIQNQYTGALELKYTEGGVTSEFMLRDNLSAWSVGGGFIFLARTNQLDAYKSIYPTSDNTIDLGNDAERWRAVYSTTNDTDYAVVNNDLTVDGIIYGDGSLVFKDEPGAVVGFAMDSSTPTKGLIFGPTNATDAFIWIKGNEYSEGGGATLGVYGSTAASTPGYALLVSDITLPNSQVWIGHPTDDYELIITNGFVQITADMAISGDIVGQPTITNVADAATEIVNYITMTNWVTTGATTMTNQVSFPNGIYVAGTLIDGSVSTISVASVSFDADFIPTVSNAYDIGSSNYPVADIYVSTSTIYFVGGPEIVGLSVGTNGHISTSVGTNAPIASLLASDIGVTVQGYDADTVKADIYNVFTSSNKFGGAVNIGEATLTPTTESSYDTITMSSPSQTTSPRFKVAGANNASEIEMYSSISGKGGYLSYANSNGVSQIVMADDSVGARVYLNPGWAYAFLGGTNSVDFYMDMLPNADNTIDLGSVALRYRSAYANTGNFDVVYANEITGITYLTNSTPVEVHTDAVAGQDIVNYQTMTGMNYVVSTDAEYTNTVALADSALQVELDEKALKAYHYDDSEIEVTNPEWFQLDANGRITGLTVSATNITNLVIPWEVNGQAVTGIADFNGGNSPFRNNNTITNLVAPKSFVYVGAFVFESCTSLKAISLPNVITMGWEGSFYGCTGLISISLPNVITIAPGAFYNSTSLTSISLPSVTTIGSVAFDACTSLTSISLPNATYIGDYAFSLDGLPQDSSSLTSVSIPKVTHIGEWAFSYNNLLTSLELPSVINVGDYAFAYLTSLKSVYWGADTVPTLGESIFMEAGSPVVTNYVTNPQATGWPSGIGGAPGEYDYMPVVRPMLYSSENATTTNEVVNYQTMTNQGYLTAETDPVYSSNTYATAMNQGVASTDSPTFAGATINGQPTITNIANSANEIVNYQTMTNHTQTASVLGSTNSVTYGGSDASGANAGFHYFAIGGLDSVAQTNNGAWRMGIVNSNLTVQVRVAGAWTNATAFTRP